MTEQKRAVIVFSGGLDSTTCLAIAKSQGFECYTLSFDYGQKSHSELAMGRVIAARENVADHKIFPIRIDTFGHSALTDDRINVPDYCGDATIPVTYVPARNTIFLSIALAYAEVLQARDIFVGVSHIDYSNYPDCRPEYINAFQIMANLATKAGVEGHHIQIHTPIVNLSKAATIQLGMSLGVDYSLTVSCYHADAAGKACGTCASCTLRRIGFAEANILDPTRYIASFNPSDHPLPARRQTQHA